MLKKLNKEELLKKWEKQHPTPADQRAAKPDEKENSLVAPSIAKSFTDAHIELLFPKKALSKVGWNTPDAAKKKLVYVSIRSACARLRLHPLKSYTVIKDRIAYTFDATDSYPIFMVDEGDIRLIYQPLHADPDHIYQYYGERPEVFIHGFAQAAAHYQKQLDDQVVETKPSRKRKGAAEETPKKKKPIEKIDQFILVQEPAEAFGPALLGYFTGYHGGTKNVMQKWDYIKLAAICDIVYQVRINNDLGIETAHAAGLAHLDLVTVELPDLYEETNHLGWKIPRPIITLRDYLTWHNDHDFKELLEDSMPYQFWDTKTDYAGRGDDKMEVGFRYEFSHTRAYNFLNKMGFYRLPVKGEKADYVYVRKDGNIIRKTKANDVKNFINGFLKERRVDHNLRDYIYNRGQLSESSLSNLEDTTIDFKDFDAFTQYQFFKNGTYEVTAESIKLHAAGSIKRYVWDTDVIEHEISLAPSPFKATQHKDGKSYDIKIEHTNCLFFNYLIQTSRMHWREEIEVKHQGKPKEEQDAYRLKHKFDIEGPLLSDEERFEQKQHLLNKIYALGYLMHRNKSRSQSWAVVAVDNNTPADGKSYGGTGKSICFNQGLISVIKNHHSIPGTNAKITDNPHIFHGLVPEHRVLIIDDAAKDLNFRFFFEFITGNQTVNPKNNTPFTIPFEQLAKLVWLTNFSFLTDPSTNRRILYTAFSDWYHAKSDRQEAYEPKDDFGLDLFTDFKPEHWNQFYNTMAYCLQFYLQCPIKLSAPMKNVDKRNLQREMGEQLETWAGLYFSPIGDNINRIIIKSEAYKDFMADLPKGFSYSITRFKTSIEAYCRYHGYVLNPEDMINDKANNRIVYYLEVKKLDNSGWAQSTGKKKTEECLYVQTDFEKPLNTTPPECVIVK